MITIPTGDLTGILSDVLPFAYPNDEDPPVNAVRIEWDGDMLHAAATDRLRYGWSSWHPDDQPDDETQDDLFTAWGGTHEPFTLVIPLDDAKHIVKTFKVGKDDQRIPVTLNGSATQLTVHRSRQTGHSDLTAVVQHQGGDFPDVTAALAKADTVTPVGGIKLTAKHLADYAKVRPSGPLELTFTGDSSPVLVTIGDSFNGAIMPVYDGRR